MKDYGCRWRLPHDVHKMGETPRALYQKCAICRKQWTWTKDYKGRMLNKEYLKVNARAFAQRSGPTRGLFNRLYKPEKVVIHINI